MIDLQLAKTLLDLLKTLPQINLVQPTVLAELESLLQAEIVRIPTAFNVVMQFMTVISQLLSALNLPLPVPVIPPVVPNPPTPPVVAS